MADIILHPECERVVEYTIKQQLPNKSQLSVDQMRQNTWEKAKVFSGYEQPFNGLRRELFIPSTDITDGIPVFVYTPDNVSKDPAILVYFHGGGMVFGSRYSLDASCKGISSAAECIVVNVEYRLAPEHKFPAMMEDAETAVKWVKENKLKLGGTDHSLVGIGGDSAGGTISASIGHDVPVDFQVLVYPNATRRKDLESVTKYANGPLLTRVSLEWYEKMFIPPGEESNPRLASLLRPRFDHLPPALILVAEHDMLYSGCYVYADKLQEHGVPVDIYLFKGAIHGFFPNRAYCPSLCAEAYGKIADFIKRIKRN